MYTNKRIKIIVCTDKNGGFSYKNEIPWFHTPYEKDKNDVKNDMLKVFPRGIMGAIELIPTVTEPRYMARLDAFHDDLNIVFSFKMSLSFNLDFKQQEETLETVKYLYENFEQFKDSLEETLVDALRNSSFEDVKN